MNPNPVHDTLLILGQARWLTLWNQLWLTMDRQETSLTLTLSKFHINAINYHLTDIGELDIETSFEQTEIVQLPGKSRFYLRNQRVESEEYLDSVRLTFSWELQNAPD